MKQKYLKSQRCVSIGVLLEKSWIKHARNEEVLRRMENAKKQLTKIRKKQQKFSGNKLRN